MKKMLIGMAALLGAASANAAIIPTLVGGPVAVDGGFRYTYNVFLNPASAIGQGDGFTIYDFAGFVEGSDMDMADIDFEFSFDFTGPEYYLQDTATFDDGAVPNLTWTYNGTDLFNDTPPEDADAEDIFLGTVSAISEFGDITSDLTSSNTRSNAEETFGDPQGSTGPVTTPVDNGVDVPEPGMLGLLGLGVLGLAAARRRKA